MSENRKLAAIMFTDIVGFTTMMSREEDKTLSIIKKNQAAHVLFIQKHGGVLNKEIGDGMLGIFPSCMDAILCAQELINFSKKNDFQLRIGINEGEIIQSKKEIYGDGINLTSRIQTAAEPGRILVSESVYRNLSNKSGIRIEFLTETNLKHIDYPVKLYTAIVENNELLKKRLPFLGLNKSKLKTVALVFAIVLVAFIAWLNRSQFAGNELPETSLVILPMENLTGDKSLNYISDGITETLSSTISQEDNIRIFRKFNKNAVDNNEFKKANVNYMLKSSIVKKGDSLVINYQLFNVTDNSIVEANESTIQEAGAFSSYEQIVGFIKKNLVGERNESETIPLITQNKEAFDLYLKAFDNWCKIIWTAQLSDEVSKQDLVYLYIDESSKYFKLAIQYDSALFDAYVKLKYLYAWDLFHKTGDSLYLDSGQYISTLIDQKIDQKKFNISIFEQTMYRAVDSKDPKKKYELLQIANELNPDKTAWALAEFYWHNPEVNFVSFSDLLYYGGKFLYNNWVQGEIDPYMEYADYHAYITRIYSWNYRRILDFGLSNFLDSIYFQYGKEDNTMIGYRLNFLLRNNLLEDFLFEAKKLSVTSPNQIIGNYHLAFYYSIVGDLKETDKILTNISESGELPKNENLVFPGQGLSFYSNLLWAFIKSELGQPEKSDSLFAWVLSSKGVNHFTVGSIAAFKGDSLAAMENFKIVLEKSKKFSKKEGSWDTFPDQYVINPLMKDLWDRPIYNAFLKQYIASCREFQNSYRNRLEKDGIYYPVVKLKYEE